MSPKELLLKITEAYQDARRPYQVDARIRRGRSHSVSSITEDLFALYLVSNDKTIDFVYVDQPVTFNSLKKIIYPDIVITRSGVVTALIDIKMDLGWNRNGLFDLCKKHHEVVKKIKCGECHLKDGMTKKGEKKIFTVSKDISYNVIIISNVNVSPLLLGSQLEQVRSLGPDVEVFILCDKGHPNSYDIEPNELIKKLGVNEAEFSRLRRKLS